MNNFKVLVKQIINDCREQNKLFTPALTSFVVETLYNPETGKFFIEDGINESNVEEIKRLSVEKLSNLTAQQKTLLDLQIKHEGSLIDQDYFWTEKLRAQTEQTTTMIDNILQLTHSTSNNYDTLSQLYQRIFNFLIFKNKSLLIESDQLNEDGENSSISSMEKEVAAALESVIPRAALSPFIMLNNSEKVTQLTELSNLVLGIRLFNKEIGKGGNTIQEMNELIEKIDNEFLESIRSNVLEAVGMTEKYAFYFDYKLNRQDEEFDEQDHVLNTELMFLRQYTNLLMNLMEKVESSVGICESAEGRYLKEIADLKTLLGSKSSAPKEQVYPKFAVLANGYMQIVEESKHASDKIELFEMLKSVFDQMTFSLGRSHQMKGENYANELRRKHEEDIENSVEEEIISKNNVIYIEPKHTPEFLQIPLDILGFCIVTLVDNGGLLMPGQHTFGVFRYKDESFVFRSVEEAKRFIERPNFYINEFYKMCREFPQLILLLRVDDFFRDLGLTLIHIDPEQKGQATKIMDDQCWQTQDHYDKFIDHNYCWNEWELRRKAIQMANIRNMTTKGTQTADSIYHVENQSQVWLMKDSCSQTGINSGNNPIRPRNYITDLRDKTNQQLIEENY